MRVTAVVAHPDDEALFCGGTLRLFQPAEISVILVVDVKDCNTIADDPEAEASRVGCRHGAFNRSCELLGCHSVLEMHERNGGPVNRRILMQHLLNLSPDLVLTHGTNENGHHATHETHQYVSSIVRGLWSGPIWQFSDSGPIRFRIDGDWKRSLLEVYRHGGHRTPEWDPYQNPQYSAWCGPFERFTPVAQEW